MVWINGWTGSIDPIGPLRSSVARSLRGCPGKEQTGRMRQDFSRPLQIDGDRNSWFFRKRKDVFVFFMYTIIVYIIIYYCII